MIIEGQGLKVRKGQYVRAPHFFSGLNNTICHMPTQTAVILDYYYFLKYFIHKSFYTTVSK